MRTLEAPRHSAGHADYAAGCTTLAHGFDTMVETYSVEWQGAFLDRVEEARREAENLPNLRDGEGVPFEIAGRTLHVMPHGARGGASYVLRDPDAMLFLREARDPARRKPHPYNLTVKYLSAGLWQSGYAALADATRATVAAAGELVASDAEGVTEPTISRADYAVDLHAPAFSLEASPALVAHFLAPAHAKWQVVGKGDQAQTFAVGSLPRLQVTLYDKSREIREASGKDWMRALWQWPPPSLPIDAPCADVWRIEVRMGEEFLKDRNVRGPGALMDRLDNLLAGALIDRRLTVPDRARPREAAMHPLWFLAYEAVHGARETPTVGRLCTHRQDEYRALMVRSLAGTLRSAAVAETGGTEGAAIDDLVQDAVRTMRTDPEHARRVQRARERFRWLTAPT